MKTKTSRVVFFLVLISHISLMAQIEPEEVTTVSDNFQDSFYESTLQKGIENYDKAIISLEKCLKIYPNNATIYFELGKNYLALKQYDYASKYFQKAIQIDPKNKWFWVGVYELNCQTKKFSQAIQTLKKLIEFDENYTENLIALSIFVNQPEEALRLIAERDAKYGKSFERTQYRNQILSRERTQKNDWHELTAFKNYLDATDGEKAIACLYKILANTTIDFKIKHRVLNEYLVFIETNPQFEVNIESILVYFENNKTVDVTIEIGKFYHKKQQWEKAIKYYLLSLKNNENAIEPCLLLLQVYADSKQFDLVKVRANAFLELYPSQPHIYYYLGIANNKTGEFEKAIKILTEGQDYIIENKDLEIKFYSQLAEAHKRLGNSKQNELFTNKAKFLQERKD